MWRAGSGVPLVFVSSRTRSVLFAAGIVLGSGALASAETLTEALASAYINNPTLNAQRAALRATDEGVPQALAGYRPIVFAAADLGIATAGSVTLFPRGISLTVEQPIFRGFRTETGLKIAETAVLAGREALRVAEQGVLLNAVQAFMNLIQAQAILNLSVQNLKFQVEEVRAADDRLSVGEGTRTDVEQTKARFASGQFSNISAQVALNNAIAVYEIVIGHQPKVLGAAAPVDPRLPKSLDAGMAYAMAQNPSIRATSYNIDIAAFNVKMIEGEKLPTIGLAGTVSRRDDFSFPGSSVTGAELVGRIRVPIYTGGSTNSRIRQAKQTLGQRRIEHDSARANIRGVVISAWGSVDAARARIRAAEVQVAAERLVLSGVTEERNVGQRTTLDVLDAQRDLLDARVDQIRAQYDRVVAAYTLLAAAGLLSAEDLGLSVVRYQPGNHYNQVRDRWHGMRTPDGR
jgi:outer membrane protein